MSESLLPNDSIIQAVADALAKQAESRQVDFPDPLIRAWAMDAARLAVRVVRETEQSQDEARVSEAADHTWRGATVADDA